MRAASLWRARAQQPLPDPVATFSILGYDPATGEIGGAVQSRVFSVGNGVLWAEAGVGVVATQAIVDVSYGPKGLALLRAGHVAAAIIKAIWDSDPDPRPDNWTKQGRQFAVIDAKGNVAVFTGPKASTWAGDKQGKFCTAQGNILAGEAGRGQHGQGVRRDDRPPVAAADGGARCRSGRRRRHARHAVSRMLIVGKGMGVWLNNDVVLRLQVDDSPEPLKEMRRLVEGWNQRRRKNQQRPSARRCSALDADAGLTGGTSRPTQESSTNVV